MEIFRTTVSPNGVSPPVQKGLQELTEYPKKTSEPSTVESWPVNQTSPHWSKKHPLNKEKLSLDRQIEALKEEREREDLTIVKCVRANITPLKKESQAFQPELHSDRFKKDEIQEEK